MVPAAPFYATRALHIELSVIMNAPKQWNMPIKRCSAVSKHVLIATYLASCSFYSCVLALHTQCSFFFKSCSGVRCKQKGACALQPVCAWRFVIEMNLNQTVVQRVSHLSKTKKNHPTTLRKQPASIVSYFLKKLVTLAKLLIWFFHLKADHAPVCQHRDFPSCLKIFAHRDLRRCLSFPLTFLLSLP